MDRAYASLGKSGTFQKIIVYIVLVNMAITLFLAASFPFLTRRPVFLCSDSSSNAIHRCNSEDVCADNTLSFYAKDPELSSINFSYEFDLFCEKEYYIKLLGSAFFFGGVIGTLIISPFPDKIGRSPVLKCIIFSSFFVQVNLLFCLNMFHLVVVYFCAGLLQYGGTLTNVVVREYLDSSKSGILIALNNVMFSVTGMVSGLFFLTVNSWKMLVLFTLLLSMSIMMLSYNYLFESPRWLISQRKEKECLETLMNIAKVNKREENLRNYIKSNPAFLASSNMPSATQKDKPGIFRIFTLQSQRFKLVILSYLWFACSFNYFGLIINLDYLKGNNFFLYCYATLIAQMISQTLSGLAADKYGRLMVLRFVALIGGIGFICYEIAPNYTWIRTALICVTSIGLSAAFSGAFIYTPEAFPTTIRSTCYGFLFLISRIGAVLVPTASLLLSHTPVLFGTMSIISSFLLKYLPETLGKDLEEDVPEFVELKLTLLSKELSKSNCI